MQFPISRRQWLATSALVLAQPLLASSVWASCAIQGTGTVNLIGNSFPAIQHMADTLAACNQPGLNIQFKITPQARQEIEQAFAMNGPSPFDVAQVSMGVFSNLNSLGQLQPMTDLVEKYRAQYNIEDSMLVRVNGEVMAIAFMRNAQNLFYRKDLFEKHGLQVPTTYEDMLKVAAELRAKEPGIQFPIAQTFAQGWDSATEFVNLMAGFGGSMFAEGSARAAFNGAEGVKAIELMRSMTEFMTPNYLASNSDDVMNQFQQGRAAMGVLWASRAQRMDDPAASTVVGQMAFAAAPAAVAGGPSATHLWWDGLVMARNMTADRDLAFQVMMEALSERAVSSGNDLAIWVRSAYQPTRFGQGVVASAQQRAPIWPSQPYFSLAHAEIGKVLPDALTGAVSPQAALDAAAEAYAKAAAERGFLQ